MKRQMVREQLSDSDDSIESSGIMKYWNNPKKKKPYNQQSKMLTEDAKETMDTNAEQLLTQYRCRYS